ncbi:uncharacterized protein [Watersipora subatra]|uniref:uncharacterized protein n=1 Tax=Watersipora subatra TaxID=2589382 RepID=UPI00355C651A
MLKTICLVAVTFSVLILQANANNVTSNSPNAVECIKCNSHPSIDGAACYDPIDLTQITATEMCDSGFCLKYVQNVEKDIKQINRGCAEHKEPLLDVKNKDEGCVLSTGTKLIQLEVCNCKGNRCNGAVDFRSTTSVIMAASLLAVIAKLLH